LQITVVAAHENQVFRANGFRNALQKLSGNDDIRVALISNTKALNVHSSNTNTSHSHDNDSPDSTLSTLVGDVAGRKCIIVDDIINTGGTMRSAIDFFAIISSVVMTYKN
jgi:phosphoribosylpyrophosphate synthetase